MNKSFDFFPTVESRILAGIFFFTGILIVTAWVIINEPGRMEEFTERFEGRSVESGALLFENNCATCHGPEGYGIANAGPALNNPLLFGYNFFAEFELQREPLNQRLDELQTLVDLGTATEEELTEVDQIKAQLDLIDAQQEELTEKLLYDYQPERDAAEIRLITYQLQVLLDLQLAAPDQTESIVALQTELNEAAARSNVEAIEVIARIRESVDFAPASPPRLALQVSTLQTALEPLQTEFNDLAARIGQAQAEGGTPSQADIDRQNELSEQIAVQEDEIDRLTGYLNELTLRSDIFSRFDRLMDAHNEVLRLRTAIAEGEGRLLTLPSDSEEYQAVLTQVEADQTALSEQEDTRDAVRAELIAANEAQPGTGIVPFDPEATSRIEDLKWAGSLYALIETTLISGRPTSTSYWPRAMQAWSQTAGGPLRPDQIRNLTDFIMNWERDFTIADVRNIQQYARVPGLGGAGVENAIGLEADVADIVAQFAELESIDPTAGQASFNGAYGCGGCHNIQGGAGPLIQGVATRAEGYVGEEFEGVLIETPAEYLAQSILYPNAYLVEGYNSGVMPQNFGANMDVQTLANIVAYLESLGE